MNKLFLLVLLFFLCLSVSVKATDFSQCINVTVNNTVFDQTASFTNKTFTNCINVQDIAYNDTIDCHGYTISGNNETTVGIYVRNTNGDVTNITVQNCNFINVSYGVDFEHSNNNTAINNTMSKVKWDGCVMFSGANNSNFINNSCYGAGSSGVGVMVKTSYNNIIQGGTVQATGTSYDYDVEQLNDNSNVFINTNFTVARKISFYNTTLANAPHFVYRNDSSSLTLETYHMGRPANVLTRTLNNWTQNNITWNEQDSGTDTTSYKLSGLIVNANYTVWNLGAVVSTINSTNAGSITFNINMNTTARTISVNTSASSGVNSTDVPNFPSVGTNTTNLGNTVVQFQINVNTTNGISGYILSLDNATGSLVNKTWTALTGTSNWTNSTANYLMNNSAGTIRYQVFANSTDNDWSNTSIYSFTQNGLDVPIISSLSTNTTQHANQTVDFIAKIQTVYALSGYIISIDNNTGTFTNQTWVSLTGTTNWTNSSANYLTDIYAGNIRWIIYANSSDGDWQNSSIQSFGQDGNTNKCIHMTAENGTYTLSGDMLNVMPTNDTWPAGGSGYYSCMKFYANNVTFNCQGHTMSGGNFTVNNSNYGNYFSQQAISNTYSIAYGFQYQNDTAKNCVLQNWDTAIALDNWCAGCGTVNWYENINNMTIINSGVGIELWYNNYTNISNIKMTNMSVEGIRNYNSHFVRYDNISIADYKLNMTYGFYSVYSSRNAINNLTIINSTANTMWFELDNLYNITNSSLQGGSGIDIRAYNGNGNNFIVRNNLINVTGTDYIIDDASGNSNGTILNFSNIAGTRIIGSGNLGGNFYANSTHNGYSEICSHTIDSTFCDTPITFATGGTTNMTDYLPLYSDLGAPTYSQNSSAYANPYSNSIANLTIAWTDTALDTIDIYENVTGSWTHHYTSTTGNGTLSVSEFIPAYIGTYCWNSTANDSSNNLGSSDTWCFHVSANPPIISNVQIQDCVQVNNNLAVYFNQNDLANLYLGGSTRILQASVGQFTLPNGTTVTVGSNSLSSGQASINYLVTQTGNYYLLINVTNNDSVSNQYTVYFVSKASCNPSPVPTPSPSGNPSGNNLLTDITNTIQGIINDKSPDVLMSGINNIQSGLNNGLVQIQKDYQSGMEWLNTFGFLSLCKAFKVCIPIFGDMTVAMFIITLPIVLMFIGIILNRKKKKKFNKRKPHQFK